MKSTTGHRQRRGCSDAMSLDAASVSSEESTSNDTSGRFIPMKNPTNVSYPPAESTSVGETTSCSTSRSTKILTFLHSRRVCHQVPPSPSKTSRTTNENRSRRLRPQMTLPTRPPHHLHTNLKQLSQAWACLGQSHTILLTTPLPLTDSS